MLTQFRRWELANIIFCSAAVSVLLPSLGCSNRPGAVPLPKFRPTAAGTAAIEQYDEDGDGALGAEEMKRIPGVMRSLGQYDQNDDGSVTADEIAARLQEALDHKLGLCPPFGCTVLLNGRPLRDATVTFIPEECIGDSVKTATGTTDERGVARVQVPQDDLPKSLQGIRGIQPGLFKVQIEHPQVELPARYNQATMLGQEISNESILMRSDDTVYRLSLD